MKVVIYATNSKNLLKDFPLLEEYKDFYNANDDYWRGDDNYIVKEMDDDELVKVIQMLTNYGELVVSKEYHKHYGTYFFIEIYNDWRE
jgi:hypothetical protein